MKIEDGIIEAILNLIIALIDLFTSFGGEKKKDKA